MSSKNQREGSSMINLIVAFDNGLLSMDLLIKTAKKINFAYFCFILAIVYFIGFLLLI
jgi:undecaprenyl pyrophosphate phosphatase UppP